MNASEVGFWKIVSLVLVLLMSVLIFLNAFQLSRSRLQRASNQQVSQASQATTEPEPQIAIDEPAPTPVQKFIYPASAFFLSEGEAEVIGEEWSSIHEVTGVTLKLQPYREPTAAIFYTLKIQTILDSVTDPKISFNNKYVCFTTGLSGYSGYYIAGLPDGELVVSGPQYSECLAWISDHQVLIAESPFGTNIDSFYLLDARTKSKKLLSSFNSLNN